jgi:hypothetical protein
VTENELFFVGEAVRYARSLSFGECLRFLQGMLLSLPANHPARSHLSNICNSLLGGDAQMELIATGQLKLDFEKGGKSKSRK